jgi:hypothetical protein
VEIVAFDEFTNLLANQMVQNKIEINHFVNKVTPALMKLFFRKVIEAEQNNI